MLDSSAFAPLDEFPLRRRFVDRATGALPAHFAGRIRPLTAVTAAGLSPEAALRCAEAGEFTATFRSDDSPGIVNGRLRGLPPEPTTEIIIWWNSSTALVTAWGVFASHWGSFCYPAADDACIWPIAGSWTLCYRRYEVFQYRDRQPTS